jgi:TolB-like protein/DNA-binding winged helix-turn-helix (wHTH) protein/Flp pilus assembly protein TadD
VPTVGVRLSEVVTIRCRFDDGVVTVRCARRTRLVETPETGAISSGTPVSDAQPVSLLYRFGPFTLDPGSFRLSRDGVALPLTPKALEILVILVRERRRGVTKEELLDTVWAQTAVTENTLTQRIKEIREALGDSPHQPVYLRTISRVGYQFVGEIVEVSPASEPAAFFTADPPAAVPAVPEVLRDGPAPGPGLVEPRPGHWRRGMVLALVLLVAAVAVGLMLIRPGQDRPVPGQTPHSKRVMLAVLPFDNLSSDPEQEYFSTGLTEEMITELARLDPARLGVIARTSSMSYKGTTKNARTIATELGVDYILEGSVRRETDRVRIVAQLIRAQDQTHVWAERYDRELRGILSLQGEVARSVAAMMQVQLSAVGEARVGRTIEVNPDAYQAYLKGRYFLTQRTPESIERGVAHFQKAIAADPAYAPAHAGLADAFELAGSYAGVAPKETIERALAAARRARDLDPGLSEAYTSLGVICSSFIWEWTQCERDFSQALAMNANDALAHKGYSEVLSFFGRHDQAIAHARLAVELDPVSLIMHSNLGVTYYRARRLDQALKQIRQTIELDPNYMLGHLNLGMTLAATGAYDEAVRTFQRARELAPSFPDSLALLGYVYGRMGKTAEARNAARRLADWPGGQYVSPYSHATVLVGLGEKQQAIDELERAFAHRSWLMAMLKVDPVFDSLHGDPRFEGLLRRMNFPDAG